MLYYTSRPQTFKDPAAKAKSSMSQSGGVHELNYGDSWKTLLKQCMDMWWTCDILMVVRSRVANVTFGFIQVVSYLFCPNVRFQFDLIRVMDTTVETFWTPCLNWSPRLNCSDSSAHTCCWFFLFFSCSFVLFCFRHIRNINWIDRLIDRSIN